MTGVAAASQPGNPFDALGDPTRREILRILSAGDRRVVDVAAELPISRPAVSRHLRVLKDAGLVTERPEGTARLYGLGEQGVHAVQEYLQGVWGTASARFRLLAENLPEAGGDEQGRDDQGRDDQGGDGEAGTASGSSR